MTRVSFEAALRRFGCSILTPGSAIAQRPYNLAAVRAAIARALCMRAWRNW